VNSNYLFHHIVLHIELLVLPCDLVPRDDRGGGASTPLPDPQLDEDLLRLTRLFVAIAANSLVGEEGELSIQQYRALASVESRKGQRPVELARTLGVTPSTITALCDRLVQRGLISRRRGTDRRSISLSVTAKGLRQLEEIADRRRALLREIFLGLPSTVRDSLAAALPVLIDVAGGLDIDEWSIRGLVPRAT
jgi:DNA-binding MarR family transcriptional regulator